MLYLMAVISTVSAVIAWMAQRSAAEVERSASKAEAEAHMAEERIRLRDGARQRMLYLTLIDMARETGKFNESWQQDQWFKLTDAGQADVRAVAPDEVPERFRNKIQ